MIDWRERKTFAITLKTAGSQIEVRTLSTALSQTKSASQFAEVNECWMKKIKPHLVELMAFVK